MFAKYSFYSHGALLMGVTTLVACMPVYGKCHCPSDGNGAPAAHSGLGQEFPSATNIAIHPRWRVYEFERDGVEYTQVNDENGNVRAAVGRIGPTLWTMPIGLDADRVMLGGQFVPGTAQTMFSSENLKIILYQDGEIQRWNVLIPDSN